MSHSDANINGASAQLMVDKWDTRSIFGSQIIENGSYEWRIRFKTKILFTMGLIEDRNELIKLMKLIITMP